MHRARSNSISLTFEMRDNGYPSRGVWGSPEGCTRWLSASTKSCSAEIGCYNNMLTLTCWHGFQNSQHNPVNCGKLIVKESVVLSPRSLTPWSMDLVYSNNFANHDITNVYFSSLVSRKLPFSQSDGQTVYTNPRINVCTPT